MSGIGKAVSAYQKLQLDMIGKFSRESNNVLEEVPFLDEGYLYTQIERLKRKHQDLSRDLRISKELELSSEYEIQKRMKLKSQLDRVEVKMLYYALNSFQSLELCKTLSQGKEIKVTGLIQAQEEYQDGKQEVAEGLFEEYFSQNTVESAFFSWKQDMRETVIKKGKTGEGSYSSGTCIAIKNRR